MSFSRHSLACPYVSIKDSEARPPAARQVVRPLWRTFYFRSHLACALLLPPLLQNNLSDRRRHTRPNHVPPRSHRLSLLYISHGHLALRSRRTLVDTMLPPCVAARPPFLPSFRLSFLCHLHPLCSISIADTSELALLYKI